MRRSFVIGTTHVIVVVSANLVTVSDFKVSHEDLQEVEDFDCSLVRERPQWNALKARIVAHDLFP
jgi:hypothetical protein